MRRIALMFVCIPALAGWVMRGGELRECEPVPASFYAKGWVDVVRDTNAPPAGQYVTGYTYSGGNPIMETAVYGSLADLAAAQSNAAAAAKLASIAEEVERAWPLLTDHPATNEVPPAGMSYRIAETNGVVTWWIARQTDLLSTQVSSHNAAGDEITRTVNLKTGEDTTINLRKLTAATKWADLSGAKSSKTNKVKKVVAP